MGNLLVLRIGMRGDIQMVHLCCNVIPDAFRTRMIIMQ